MSELNGGDGVLLDKKLEMGAEQIQLSKLLAFLLSGLFIFLLVLLCMAGSLVESHCGATFGYYGCDTQH
jgi:hypothetical protein